MTSSPQVLPGHPDTRKTSESPCYTKEWKRSKVSGRRTQPKIEVSIVESQKSREEREIGTVRTKGEHS